MQHVSKRNKRIHGNAILLILPLAVVVVAIIQLSLYQTMNFSKTIANFRLVGVRDNLVSNVKTYASIPSTFRSSLHSSLPAGTNIELQNCVLGGMSACQNDVEMPVALYYPISTAGSASSLLMISGRAALGGPSSPAALYDIRGNLCPTTGQANAECPFEVTTSFTAKCAGGTATCAIAESISVHYSVRKAASSILLQASHLRVSIDQYAPLVLVSKILPNSGDDAKNNITTSTLTGVIDPNTSINDTLLARIEQIIRDSKVTTDEPTIQKMAQSFYDAGYTDADPYFIQEVSKASYAETDPPGIIRALGEAGIKDTATAVFLSQVNVADPHWMQLVLDVGIKDATIAYNFYWHFDVADPARVATALQTISGLPVNEISLTIARNYTDPAIAKQIYDQARALTSNDLIASGLIDGKWISDPQKSAAIVNAVSQIDDLSGYAFAKLGMTDSQLVTQLHDMTMVFENDYYRQASILDGGGDIQLTKVAINYYSTQLSQAATQSVATTTTTTSTTTTSTSNNSGTQSLSEITLISTCTTCSSITF